MSRASVRTAVASWVAPTSGVTSVFTSFPKVLSAQAFNAATPVSSGAALVVFLAGETETREALGGATNGYKRIEYVVHLHVFFRSTELQSETAMATFDSLIESLKTRLRSDHTFGGALWQAAEDAIEGEYGEPVLSGDITEIWGALKFTAIEWVNA